MWNTRAGAEPRMALVALAAVAGLLAGAPPGAAHVPHDVVNDVAVSPAFGADATLFAIVRSNLLRSTDAGGRWQRLTRGLPGRPTSVALSPAFERDRTVFVGSQRSLFRSRDAGETFEDVGEALGRKRVADVVLAPRPEGPPVALARLDRGVVFRSRDGGESWGRVLGLPSGGRRQQRVTALSGSPGMLWAGTNRGRVLGSRDAGESWSELAALPRGLHVTSLLATSSDGTLWVGTRRGLFRVAPDSPPRRVKAGLPAEEITSLAAVQRDGATTLLAATREQSVFRSADGGTRWQRAERGLEPDPQQELSRHPQFGRIAVADDGAVWVATFAGLVRSRDAGRSFEEVATLPAGIVVGLDLAAAADGAGVEVGVTTYAAGLHTHRAGEPGWRSGLASSRLGAVAFSPAYARDRQILTGTFYRVLRSRDGGASFESPPTRYEVSSPPYPGCEESRRVEMHYSSNFEFPLGFVFSPAHARDRTLFAAYWPEGLVRSTDGGDSFDKLWHGCGHPVWSLVVAPGFPEDPILLASTKTGIHRSRDGGRSFERVGRRPPFGDSGLGISPGFSEDRTVYAGGAGGLWRSRDAGATWHELEVDGARARVAQGGLVVSPFATSPRELLVQVEGGGLLRLRDAGDGLETERLPAPVEFSQMREFDRDRAPLLAYSPHYPRDGTLYAASMDGLYRSRDRGRSWQRVPVGPGAAAGGHSSR